MNMYWNWCLSSLSLCRCDVSTFCTPPQPALLSQLAQDWYMFASETTLIHIWSKWGRMVWTSSHVWINYSPSDVFQIEKTLRELVQTVATVVQRLPLRGTSRHLTFLYGKYTYFGRFRSAVFTWLARANIMCAMWGVWPSDTSTFQMGVSAHKHVKILFRAQEEQLCRLWCSTHLYECRQHASSTWSCSCSTLLLCLALVPLISTFSVLFCVVYLTTSFDCVEP